MKRMLLEFAMWAGEDRDERGAGRALMTDLQRQLRQAGFVIREGVENWDDYGWSLVVDHDGARIWCMVQASDNWLLQSWVETGFLDRLRGRDSGPAFEAVMDGILQALGQQRGLNGARWMSPAELKAS